MPEFFIIDVDASIEKVAAKLELMGEAAINTDAPMLEITTDMFRIEKELFKSGGRRGGGSWKVLDDNTIKRKGSSQILIDTGALYRSLTEVGAEFQILDVSRGHIEFGTNRPWAMIHQRGNAHSPRRPFIKFTQFDFNRWNRILLKHITKAVME